ncbi:MAG TPA: hypothetical protein VGA33_09070 [Thermoanaerobaculia bacterium]
MAQEIDLIRNVLDKQLVDKDGTKMGRVDGIALTLDDSGPPRVDHLELGLAVLAHRIHPRLEEWLQGLRKKWTPRRSARQIVTWSHVLEVTAQHVRVDLQALQTPAFDWERWLRRNIVSKIPGSRQE